MRATGLDAITNEVLSLQQQVVIVAVDGRSGSGKSTLARLLCSALMNHGLPCSRVRLDEFWVNGRLYPRMLESCKRMPGEIHAQDYEYDWRFFREVFLLESCDKNRRHSSESVSKNIKGSLDAESRAYIVDGCTALRRELRCYYDLTIYTELVGRDSLRNAVDRDGSTAYEYHKNAWGEVERRYLEEHRPGHHADYIARSYLKEGYVISRRCSA